jgi:predicted metal-dependent hydrolase
MMSINWSSGGLAEGLECYRNREFFLAHEHWESVWLSCVEPEKTFLQALIQITAAFHHLQRKNRAGTQSLLRSALRRLDRYSNEYGGVAIEPLRKEIRMWLQALDEANDSLQLPYPEIR